MPNSYHPLKDDLDDTAGLFEGPDCYLDLLDDDSRLCSDEELRDAYDCVREAMRCGAPRL